LQKAPVKDLTEAAVVGIFGAAFSMSIQSI
jgi:hypothetical protein